MLLSHILPATYQAQQQKSRAKDQMNFQREMSNTSYQRQMADMRKAGLNPILAAKMGGASTPSGALAGTPNVSQTMASTVQQATQMRMAHAQVQTQQATAKKMQIENELLGDDLKMLRKLGLSQISAKHTPYNIGGSMFLQKIIDAFKGNSPSTLLDDVSNSSKSNIRNTEKNNQFYQKQDNKVRSLKALGYIMRHPVRYTDHYFLVHPKKPDIKYKIYMRKK